ncbi:MAG: 50S ribosomal protein L4 [Candidatus Omnitrophota bacterium]
MFTLTVYNSRGNRVEDMALDKDIFDGRVNKAVVHQAVVCYQANKRAGSASTKTRGRVSGGGKKPWRQKGTGRARAGSSRSPLFRHGGVVFGPQPRDFSYRLSAKIRNSALRSSLNDKLSEKNVVLVDKIVFDAPKTKEATKMLSKLRVDSGVLIVAEMSPQAFRPLRNICGLSLRRPQDLTAYDVLRHKKLLIEKEALDKIVSRLA